MIVMPIINHDKILNIRIELNNILKVHEKVNFEDVNSSEIIVNNRFFSDSAFNTKGYTPKDVVEFIRNNSIHSKNNILISTKFSSISPLYSLYELSLPPKKVSKGLDNLYGSLLLDLKNEIPEYEKVKYIDLAKIGFTEHITDEKLELLQLIASNINDGTSNDYKKIISENDLVDLIETLDFIKIFNCEIISRTSIDLESFEKVLNCMGSFNTKEAKDLNNFYTMAKNNQIVYSKISKLYNIVYNEPLNWIHKKNDKIKLKNKDKVLKDVS